MKTILNTIMTVLGYTIIAISALFIIGYFLFMMKEIVVGLKHINYNLYGIVEQLDQGYKLII